MMFGRKIKESQTKGFTLIEILMVAAIFSMLVAITAPFAVKQLNNKRIESSAKEISYDFYNQQQNAYSGNGSQSYGILVETTKYTLFTGTSFATGTNKEEKQLTNGLKFKTITISNPSNEIVFAANSFRPNNTASLILTDSFQNFIITINQEGFINFYRQ